MKPPRISARAIVQHEGKLLCVRQRPYNDIFKAINGYWNIPGGGLDAGESLIDCLRREILEETGIKAKIGNLMYVQQFEYKDIEYLEFFFHVTNGADFVHIDLSGTTHGEQEIAEIAFVDPRNTMILPLFLTTEDLSAQTSAPTKLFSLL
ncbi:MAG TPA: NUDIX hydrolase [Candidatus Saccharimonadales bacterium]|jgi:8-oxo-dGTP diphosphatase